MLSKLDRYLNFLSNRDRNLLFFTTALLIFYISFILTKSYIADRDELLVYQSNLNSTIIELQTKHKEQKLTIDTIQKENHQKKSKLKELDEFLLSIGDDDFIAEISQKKSLVTIQANTTYYKIIYLLDFIQKKRFNTIYFKLEKSQYLIEAVIKIKINNFKN
jgi:cell division protein FtsB